jgi:PadR family transcriptional regulator AphA
MSRPTTTKYALLGVLSVHPASGYEIKKFCDCSLANFWSENYGHIYPVLKQLERERLATKVTHATPGKPAKNVYSITKAGRAVLRRWLASPIGPPVVRLEFLLRFFFAKHQTRKATLRFLEGIKDAAVSELAEFDLVAAEIDKGVKAGCAAHEKFWRGSLLYGRKNARMRIEWCEEMMRAL